MPARSTYVETRYVDPTQLHPYPGNPNRADVDEIRGSVRANGQYRPVISRPHPEIPGDYQILAGHGTTEATGAEAGKVRIEVHDFDDATARRVVAVDNTRPKGSTLDTEALLALLDDAKADGGLDGTGYDAKDFRDLLERASKEGAGYTAAVNIPQYEPVGPPPPVTALRDETRADALRERIRAVRLPRDVRDYLLAAAARHTVFNYRLAAEFYPHASADVQELMEESALVIVDLDDAIRLGYASLSETIADLRERDAAARAAGEVTDDD